jgi:membrane fusion protein (multidrug efflux system)
MSRPPTSTDPAAPAVHPDGPRPTEPPPAARTRFQRRWLIIGGAIVLLALLLGGGAYWWYAAGHESTDDAFIEGRIVRISAQVAGLVLKVAITDNQRVDEGDLLVQLDDRELRAQLAQAEASARAAEVAAENAGADARRAEELFSRQLIARQALESAVAGARARAAEAEAARKRVAELAVLVSYTRIAAPEAGRVTRRSVEEGMYVQVGQVLMTIVPDDFWVVANFKETQLTHMRPGQPAEVRVDAYKNEVLRAHIDSIQAGTGSRFSLLPPENATGNYVKVVQRVPVKIVFDPPLPDPSRLGAGMSVVVTVRTR